MDSQRLSDLVTPLCSNFRLTVTIVALSLAPLRSGATWRIAFSQFQRSVRMVNAMVGQLGSVASEVTRVAREVSTEGKLGGEAKVKGVAGCQTVWQAAGRQ